jgi:hypothetical protein
MKLSPIKPVCIAPPWTGGSPCPGHPRPIPIVPPFVPVLPVEPEEAS